MAGKPQKNLAYSVLLDFYGPVLTEKQRNLIYQNYVLDKTHQEIADGMGIARGSVTRSVNQALERIRRKFDFEAHYELAVGDFT